MIETDEVTELAERIMDALFPPSPVPQSLTVHDLATDFRLLNPLTGEDMQPDPETPA